jgi:adenylosuccinate synthase
MTDLSACKPIYEEVEGWMCSTSGISTYEELPQAAKAYLKRLEELLETPIAMVSVSPERGKTIQIRDVFSG